MRCYACNRNLSDFESTMRHPESGMFLDLCTKCLPFTGIKPVVRKDLKPELVFDDDYVEEEVVDESDDGE